MDHQPHEPQAPWANPPKNIDDRIVALDRMLAAWKVLDAAKAQLASAQAAYAEANAYYDRVCLLDSK